MGRGGRERLSMPWRRGKSLPESDQPLPPGLRGVGTEVGAPLELIRAVMKQSCNRCQGFRPMNPNVSIPMDRLAEYCRANGIARLDLFGSALRADFGPDSDIDLLVRFKSDRTPGLFDFVRIERECADLFGQESGSDRTPRRRTKPELHPPCRDPRISGDDPCGVTTPGCSTCCWRPVAR